MISENNSSIGDTPEIATDDHAPKVVAKRPRKGLRKSARKKAEKKTKRTRIFPAMSFEEALGLASAIQNLADGQKVRRVTVFDHLGKSPDSGPSRSLITASGKYGLTSGGYQADYLELTPEGAIACNPDESGAAVLKARFKLAIEGVEPFKVLYETYKGLKRPAKAVMIDKLIEVGVQKEQASECADLFIVNAEYLQIIREFSGAERLITIEHAMEELPSYSMPSEQIASGLATHILSKENTKWDRVCFYIAPIGEDNSEERKHSDLFLESIIEPALTEFNLEIKRADQIGESGVITSQIIEHVMRARLCIVDMSLHNPSAFYEMALRHACSLPIIQISRKADKLAFDVNQIRTVVIDTTDIYSLIPKLETYRSEIATQVRSELSQSATTSNPISVFMPGFTPAKPPQK